MWESIYTWWIFRWYVYRIWRRGVVVTKFRPYKLSGSKAKYFIFRRLPKVDAGFLMDGRNIYDYL